MFWAVMLWALFRVTGAVGRHRVLVPLAYSLGVVEIHEANVCTILGGAAPLAQ